MFHAVSVPVAVQPKSTEVPVTLVAVNDEGWEHAGAKLWYTTMVHPGSTKLKVLSQPAPP